MANNIGSQNQPAKVPDPVEKQPIPVLTSLPSEQLDNIESTNRNVISDLNQIQSDSWTDEEWKLYNAAARNIKAVQDAKTAKTSGDCVSKQTDKGYTLADSKKCELLSIQLHINKQDNYSKNQLLYQILVELLN